MLLSVDINTNMETRDSATYHLPSELDSCVPSPTKILQGFAHIGDAVLTAIDYVAAKVEKVHPRKVKREEKAVLPEHAFQEESKLCCSDHIFLTNFIPVLGVLNFNEEPVYCCTGLEAALSKVEDIETVHTLIINHKELLKALPLTIADVANVVVLDLSHNNLEELPWSIIYCEKLKTLDVSNNVISRLPRSLGHLRELEELKLHNNHLGVLPTYLIHFTKLKTLTVSDNPMSAPPYLVCRRGLEAIMQSLRRRIDRYYILGEEIFGSSTSTVPAYVKSLKDLAAMAILDHNVDFYHTNLPLSVKKSLHEEEEHSWKMTRLCYCSGCHMCFSCLTAFEDHDCPM